MWVTLEKCKEMSPITLYYSIYTTSMSSSRIKNAMNHAASLVFCMMKCNLNAASAGCHIGLGICVSFDLVQSKIKGKARGLRLGFSNTQQQQGCCYMSSYRMREAHS